MYEDPVLYKFNIERIYTSLVVFWNLGQVFENNDVS